MPKPITTREAVELLPMMEHWLGEYNSEETSDERREELERLMLSAEGALADKANAIQNWNEAIAGEVDALKAQIDRRQQRKKSLETLQERNKRLIHLILGGQPAKTAEWTFYYTSRKAVVIDDLSKIPEQFIRRAEPEPMKREILAALASGQFVPGAHVESTEPTLAVR